ncbi:PPE domain-containing protein [Nocardia nepalensis]|uniref:PPE domain-containing protein n=1 Tax=Nocardia nepalensis TaxID=3375448 RepID=UPI003B6786FC
MALPFIFIAQTPEEIIGQLLGGPGIFSLQATSDAYRLMAAQLDAAAADTDGSMTEMGETYRGLSSDQAQAAFRNHANSLRDQAVVALRTAQVADDALAIYTGAQSAMEVVAAHLAEFYARQAASALTIGTPAWPAALIAEMEYLEIKFEATAVMVGYAAALIPTLATLPPPITPPPPIVTNGGDISPFLQGDAPVSNTNPEIVGGHPNTTTPNTTTPTNTDPGANNVNDPGTDPGNGNPTDPGQPPTDPTQPPGDAAQPPANADQPLSPLNDAAGNPALDGSGNPSMDQGLYGTSTDSPTLAGLNGGVGSAVALGMARGGLGSMPGSSTGFRMPSSWLRGAGATYGPASNPVATGPATRGGPPRRVVAANARMRRRRRDEERKPGKVFVPGEQLEVPVLEKPPVIGVIEYDDRPAEPVIEQEVLVGVIERAEDVSESNSPLLPR